MCKTPEMNIPKLIRCMLQLSKKESKNEREGEKKEEMRTSGLDACFHFVRRIVKYNGNL